MQNNYKASWVVPASDHPRMVPDMGKAIEDIDKHRAEGKAVVWGNGTET